MPEKDGGVNGFGLREEILVVLPVVGNEVVGVLLLLLLLLLLLVRVVLTAGLGFVAALVFIVSRADKFGVGPAVKVRLSSLPGRGGEMSLTNQGQYQFQ
jgi:hypothetical protein